MGVIIGQKEYFKNLNEIKYEGKDSDNPLAYRYYDKDKIVLGKKMKDHLMVSSSGKGTLLMPKLRAYLCT